jgi:hypothetical protein
MATTGSAQSEEYNSLRDETMRRIDARNQLLSFTLVFAGTMFTIALGKEGYSAALLVYPIISFFFSASFAYNSLMLIEIGGYLRGLETSGGVSGWSTYLKARYRFIEPFEIVATSGLFVVTQVVALVLYRARTAPLTAFDRDLWTLSICATVLTVVSILYPVVYHRIALRRKP